jgi:hypothetical protein
MVIGRNVVVSFITPDKEVDILAKVDTGAYSSSIDETFFHQLGLNEESIKSKLVRNVHGEDIRDVYEVDIIVRGVRITSHMNIADRSDMKYKMILGRQDIEILGALVNVKMHEKLKKFSNFDKNKK